MLQEEKFQKLITLVEDSGELARKYFYSEQSFYEKEDKSVVTEVDTKIEEVLRAFVREQFPNDTIVGEEGEDVVGDSGYIWYIDPIDGTENFVRKIPLFSITATRLGPSAKESCAIVHNPISRQTFASFVEGGVYENENLSVRQEGKVGGRLAINVLSSKHESWIQPAKYNLVHHLGLKYGRSGSFSAGLLEFAYVAAGRLDGVVSLLNNPWDSAAGLYLNKAAGSSISIFTARTWQTYEGAIKDLYGTDYRKRELLLVSRPDIHNELCQFIGDPHAWG